MTHVLQSLRAVLNVLLRWNVNQLKVQYFQWPMVIVCSRQDMKNVAMYNNDLSTAGVDYVEVNEMKTFDSNVSMVCVTVNLTNDEEAEPITEYFDLSLSSSDMAVDFSDPTTTILIQNTDCKY